MTGTGTGSTSRLGERDASLVPGTVLYCTVPLVNLQLTTRLGSSFVALLALMAPPSDRSPLASQPAVVRIMIRRDVREALSLLTGTLSCIHEVRSFIRSFVHLQLGAERCGGATGATILDIRDYGRQFPERCRSVGAGEKVASS